jgi:hypothetical protein
MVIVDGVTHGQAALVREWTPALGRTHVLTIRS